METEPIPFSPEENEKINLKILYAEDNEMVRETLLELFELRYTSVESVSNGQELMNKLFVEGVNYDCVITDNSMPVKTGLEALQEIRANEKLKNIPVIVLTGDDLKIGDEVRNLGATCIGKPPDIEKLFEKIEKSARIK